MTSEPTVPVHSLVLYKTRPAIVRRVAGKLEIELQDGSSLRVRLKDVTLLHPGPVDSLEQLQPLVGEVLSAWELLAGEETTLKELAELVYGHHQAATAWAAWQLVADGLYFSGTPQAILARSPEEVELEQAARQARAAEAEARQAFLARAHSGHWLPEDRHYLGEVESLALRQEGTSRVLRELGRAQTPQNAHALLLELGYWQPTVDPYPQRLAVPITSPAVSLPQLPPEDRLDLTGLPAYAIDDQGNQDPDDAISLDWASGRLWVHIADVAALVKPDSAADLEARERGANLYLPEDTVSMLPPQATRRLGLGLDELSPALSVGLDVDDQGHIAGVEVTPSWVQVTRLTYEEAQAQLEQDPLRDLHRLLQRCEARRKAEGAITLDLPEVKIRVRDGMVDIQPLLPLESRALVAEAMLLAGEGVARFALAREIPLPFTVQGPPASLRESLPDGLAGMFALRRTLSRSQQSSVPGPHSGLGLQAYVRVTSPLRRYLDLVVHQQLRAHLQDRELLDMQALLERVGSAEAIGGQIRQVESLARQHWTLVYLLQNPQWRGPGVLVERQGLRGTVIIPDLGWETRVHLRDELELNSVLDLSVGEVNLPALDAYFRVESG